MAEQPQTGDDCPDPECDGHVVISSSQRDKTGDFYVRYFRCYACGRSPAGSPILISAKQIKKRRRRTVHLLVSRRLQYDESPEQ
jgi:hypothetical protein